MTMHTVATERRLGSRERIALITLPIAVLAQLTSHSPVSFIAVATSLILLCLSDRWNRRVKEGVAISIPASIAVLVMTGSGQVTWFCPDMEGYDCGPNPLETFMRATATIAILGMPAMLAMRAQVPETGVNPKRQGTHADAGIVAITAAGITTSLWIDQGDPVAPIALLATGALLVIGLAGMWASRGWVRTDKIIVTTGVVIWLVITASAITAPWRQCQVYPDPFIADYYGEDCATLTGRADLWQWSTYVAAVAAPTLLFWRHRRWRQGGT